SSHTWRSDGRWPPPPRLRRSLRCSSSTARCSRSRSAGSTTSSGRRSRSHSPSSSMIHASENLPHLLSVRSLSSRLLPVDHLNHSVASLLQHPAHDAKCVAFVVRHLNRSEGDKSLKNVVV